MRPAGSVSRRLLSYGGVVAVVVIVVVAVVALVMSDGIGRRSSETLSDLVESDNADLPDQRPQVEVLNGCGISGIAAQAHEFLRKYGFDVVNVENASAFDYEETIVIDRGGDEQIARRVARLLGTENVIRQVRPDLMLQITVILGKDYRNLKPYGEVEPQ